MCLGFKGLQTHRTLFLALFSKYTAIWQYFKISALNCSGEMMRENQEFPSGNV